MIEIKAIILAAGYGKRMKKDVDKPLVMIHGKEQIRYLIEKLKLLNCHISVVIRSEQKMLEEFLLKQQCHILYQKDYVGTLGALYEARNLNEPILVLNADVPLVDVEDLKQIIAYYEQKKHNILLTAYTKKKDLGKIDYLNKVIAIKKTIDSDLSSLGIYIIHSKYLKRFFHRKKSGNYDFPDYAKYFNLNIFVIKYSYLYHNINSINDLDYVMRKIEYQYKKELLNSGVLFEDIHSCFVSFDSVVEPGVYISRNSHIENSYLFTGTKIIDSKICNTIIIDSEVEKSIIKDCYIGKGNLIGPFSHLRNHTNIGCLNIIGTCVELNDVKMQDHNRIKHHSYLGNVIIGNNCNIGAFVVSANYDGVNKYASAIYDEVFIGCNSVLVSPFLLKNNTYVACGSILKGMIEQNSVILNNSKTMKSLYDTKTLFERLRTKG